MPDSQEIHNRIQFTRAKLATQRMVKILNLSEPELTDLESRYLSVALAELTIQQQLEREAASKIVGEEKLDEALDIMKEYHAGTEQSSKITSFLTVLSMITQKDAKLELRSCINDELNKRAAENDFTPVRKDIKNIGSKPNKENPFG